MGGVLQRWAGNTVKRWDFLGENQRNLWFFFGKMTKKSGDTGNDQEEMEI